ncbi:MAG: hypothetical protein RRB13_13920 [bacterium]|nr:hypothetical protein [bacterium]
MNRSFLLFGVDQMTLALRSDSNGRLTTADLDELFEEGSFYLDESSDEGFGFRPDALGLGDCFAGAKLIATDLDGPGPLNEGFEGAYIYQAQSGQQQRVLFQDFMMLKTEPSPSEGTRTSRDAPSTKGKSKGE